MPSITPPLDGKKHLNTLRFWAQELATCPSWKEKRDLLDRFFYEEEVESCPSALLRERSVEEEVVLKACFAAGQGSVFLEQREEVIASFLRSLYLVETFYWEMGGIIGYQYKAMECLLEEEKREGTYLPPERIDLSEETAAVRHFILQGIKGMKQMAEIYPVGGAADRLSFYEGEKGAAVPAACLYFEGKTLLERLIEDLQAREFLYHKLFQEPLVTPIILMTAREKENKEQILSLCEEKGWFGREKESFRFLAQPSVPVMDKEGKWIVEKGQLLLRPGGHGVLWKLLKEEGLFSWLQEVQGKTKGLIRQINNLLAGVDYGLLAFTGVGHIENKAFGFASCPRREGVAEGVNVLLKKQWSQGDKSGYVYTLTSREYCQLERIPALKQKLQEKGERGFPANTNILFVDFQVVGALPSEAYFPGLLLNFKPIFSESMRQGARLEATMQNIADYLTASQRLPEADADADPDVGKGIKLPTYLTLNAREKTISTIKRIGQKGDSLQETPEACLKDLMQEGAVLLHRCGVKVPSLVPFFYHPALGPLYSVIAQKIRGGKIAPNSELRLEIAELDMEDIDLEGSLWVEAENIMGHKEGGILRYSSQMGKCTLKNVTIRNKGLQEKMQEIQQGKDALPRRESCHIVLKGNGEFYAENVLLEGEFFLKVEEGTRVRATQKQGGGVILTKEPLQEGLSWLWEYKEKEGKIVLQKKRQ